MSGNERRRRPVRGNSGFAYVALLFLLIICVTLGLTFVATSGAELGVATQAEQNAKAQYLAEAAVRHATWRMENDCTFAPDVNQYYMHDMNGGRYGYRVNFNYAGGIALVWALGLSGDQIVEQNYVVASPNPSQGNLWALYGDTTTTGKSRRYAYTRCDGAWGSEANAYTFNSSETRWVVSAAHRGQGRLITAMINGNGEIRANAWDGAWSTTRIFSTNTKKEYRSLDVAFEAISGEALVVGWAGITDRVNYNTWTGGSWGFTSSGTAFTETGANEFWFVSLGANPLSNEILVAASTKDLELFLHRWTGTAFTRIGKIGTNVSANIGAPVRISYETGTGHGLVVWGVGGSSTPKYGLWNGTSFTEGTLPSFGATPYIFRSASSPNSERIVVGAIDNQNDLNLCEWNGNLWGSVRELDSDAEQVSAYGNHNFDVIYEQNSGAGLAVWARSGSNSVSYVTWEPGTAITTGAIQTGPNFLDRIRGVRLCTIPSSDRAALVVNTAGNVLRSSVWTGSQFEATTVQLKTGMSLNEAMPFALAAL